MSSVRRPLLTATAAGTLLCALWFVPSANASQDAPARGTAATSSSPRAEQVTQARVVTATAAESADEAAQAELADTGSFDTTPYVVGGSLFLAVGAGFVVYSVRRERLGF
ncbi:MULTISPECIES: LAETG motif-containing sortase-dependent surface protein [unclassified Streptomyces]|uniref:LAETG motif-containing sortase-dependent surface protein n=1 Tax=unclassified Streptomyces TaxID=2593676 RepID=UPI0004BEF4CF|nr:MULTISPECIES: LAETG motif-containing sortase-dependent surface protein [unclassified Streptomyces]